MSPRREKTTRAKTSALEPADLADTAALLRRVLALVETGELEATSPTARAVLRRLEGAAIAVELAAGTPSGEREKGNGESGRSRGDR